MSILLSIWLWLAFVSGFLQAEVSQSFSTSSSPKLITTDKAKAAVTTSSPKGFTKPKLITANGSLLIASFLANITHNSLIRGPVKFERKVSPWEGEHYFARNFSCENVQLTGLRGSFFNPGYPSFYSNETFCSWTILAEPSEIITISFDDLDIPEDDKSWCNPSNQANSLPNESCCHSSALIIRSANKSIPERRFCGHSEDNRDIFKTFISQPGESIDILFRGVFNNKSGRGFHLTYSKTWIGKPCIMETEFKCSSGKCIDKSWACNRRDECGDQSDEAHCDHVCRESNEAQCLKGATSQSFSCYSFPKERCDGTWNCPNGTDERDCDKCPRGMFVCSAGHICYSEAARCDGNWDCVDFKDELNCGSCGSSMISCGSSSLKDCFNPYTQRCNGIFDCPNGKDEMGCEKLQCEKKILCAKSDNCFSLEERCNGIADCSDSSDERNCTIDLCRPEHGNFLCSNGNCLPSSKTCDRVNDCTDGSDEINCTIDLCRPEQGNFLCANGNCIRSILTCDRSNDCGDNSDEINCLKNSVITAALMGSLICGLLLVIAISCTCKLIALRQIEQQHQAQDDSTCAVGIGGSSSSHLYSSHVYHRYFHFGGAGGSANSSPLFTSDNEYFYRDPPPSYASAVAGLDDFNNGSGSSRSSRRRPRRIRSRNRRRPPTPPPLQQSPSEMESNTSGNAAGGINNCPSTHATSTGSEEPGCISSSHRHQHHPDRNKMVENGKEGEQHELEEDEEVSGLDTSRGEDTNESIPDSASHHHHQHHHNHHNHNHHLHHNCCTSSAVTIELNNIPSSPSQLDCDQQPLLSG